MVRHMTELERNQNRGPVNGSLPHDPSSADLGMRNSTTSTPMLEEALQQIVSDPRYTRNVAYGKPRPGHPEGNVAAHISELEKNLATLAPHLKSLCESDAEHTKLLAELKLLIHTHDTFKAESEKRVPIAHERSHASLARKFLEEFVSDQRLLAVAQQHDVPFSLYRQHERFGDLNEARFAELCDAIPDWKIFLTFQLIDNTTAGKVAPQGTTGPVEWFLAIAEEKKVVPSTASYVVLHEELKRSLAQK